jgi:hypothetical protein
MNHQLHKKIGDIVQDSEFSGCKIVKSTECGGKQNIPLFCSKVKSNETEYCNVDLLILKNNRIKVIIEIEEANIKPTQICGKFLTSALSPHYVHESENNKIIDMDNSVSFVQILDTSKLKMDKTSKIEQWKNIEKSIQNIIPVKGSKIDKYKLFFGDISEFYGEKINEIVSYIQGILI